MIIRNVKPLQHAAITFFTHPDCDLERHDDRNRCWASLKRKDCWHNVIKPMHTLESGVSPDKEKRMVVWMATTSRSQCCGFIKWVMWSLSVETCTEKVFSGEVDVWECAASVPNVLQRRKKLVYSVYWQHWLTVRNHTPSTDMQHFGLLLCFLL